MLLYWNIWEFTKNTIKTYDQIILTSCKWFWDYYIEFYCYNYYTSAEVIYWDAASKMCMLKSHPLEGDINSLNVYNLLVTQNILLIETGLLHNYFGIFHVKNIIFACGREHPRWLQLLWSEIESNIGNKHWGVVPPSQSDGGSVTGG